MGDRLEAGMSEAAGGATPMDTWSRLPPGGGAAVVLRISDRVIVAADQAMCTAIGLPLDQVMGMTTAEAGLTSPWNDQRLAEIERLGSLSREYRFGDHVIDTRISVVTLAGERCVADRPARCVR